MKKVEHRVKIALLITALPMPSYFPSANPSLALSVTPTLLSTIGPQGTEFQANTYTTDSQYHSAIAALADGGYVITWQSNGQDGSGYGVYAQRYTSSGVPYGSEFRVNTYTADHQYGPAIAALADGGYVITWQSNGQDGSGYGVYAQRYASSGIAYGSEFQVNTYTVDSQYNPAIAALADGGYVITWQGYGQDGSGWGVYAQRYASSGVAYGQEFLMMITYLDYVRNPGIAALADGGYIITSNNYQLVYAQRYASSSATYGLEFQVNSYVGDFYRDNSAIAALADGGYVITWQSYNQDGSAYGVYAQQYAPSGIAYGPEFRVNTYTANNQHVPAIAALADGGYVITWESFDQDRSFSGVYAQRYTSSGVAYGPEFQVNTYTASYESNPAIAALADGGYIITWEGYNQDGSGWGVYAQRFNSNGDKINPRQTSEPTFFPTPAPTPLPTQPTFFPTLSPTALPSFMPTPTPNTYLNLFDGVIYDLQEMSPEKFIATGSVEKYGAGGKDVFLAAFNHDGSIAWSTVFGQTGEDISYSVCVLKNAGNSGYLLAGSSMSTDSKTPRLLLVLVSAQGTIVWAKIMIGMKADLAYAVVETRDGNALIAGTVHSYGAGSSDGFVIKVDINGNRLWAKTVGGVDAEGVFAIKENGVGEIFIAGYTSNAGNKDVLVAKLDASGNLLWLKSIGTAKNEQANGLYLTEDHYIMIAGSTGASETAGLLAKLDASNGALILAMTIADIGDTKVLSIDSSNPDAWIVSGSTSALGGKKTFVLQLTPEGELIRIKRVDRSSQGISTVRRMSTGGYVLAGSSEGGSSESLIAKINNQLEIEDCEGIDDALLTYTDITANMHVANTSFGVRTISPGLLYYSLDSQSIVMTVSNNCAQTPAKKGNQGNPILWIIIGLTVVSSVLGLLIVAGIIFYCYQRTHKKREFTVILPDHDDGVEMTFPVLPSSIQLIPSAELIVDTKEPLGKGGFGIVYAGTWQTTKVAVKQLKAEHLSEKALASFRQEAQQHWSLRHENILILYGTSVDTSHPSMVMELMVTSLYHLLRREQTLEWPTRCSIAQDIARGLHYLHNLDILHRDLKSHNILLDQQNRAKLSDFGLSKTRLETTTRDTFTSSTRRAPGTLYWMAPEILDLRAKHTKLSDVYALGMVYWEISSREHPFQEYDNADKGELVKDFIKEGGRLTIPTETPPIFSQLITRCWAQQAADRPVCANIVQELERIREAPDSTPAANFSDPFSSALNKSSIQINI